MASFASKLARLPPMPGAAPASAAAPAPAAASAPASAAAPAPEPVPVPENAAAALKSKPSLDELRDRIARIIGKAAPTAPRPDPTRTELPFFVEHTTRGPLYVRRDRTPPAARVGRAPLVAARDAEPGLLSLLALDPALATCNARRALFIDTETTGLQGGTGTVAFLLGMSFYDEAQGAFILEQALLRRLGEEGPILELLARRLDEASMIVTFNGKAFDMPLLRARFVMNRMPPPRELPHLDLVHVARRIHGHRLKSRTLAAIESEVLGRERVGDVGGADVVACYMHYLRTSDEGALSGVVTHNEHDVLSMVALVGLYGEPMHGGLPGADLAGVAKTLRRAGELDRAAETAEAAVKRGGGALAKRTRGDIAKARGDKARALLDYEALAEEVDDPSVRLELAKLYEHHVKSFAAALALVDRGTGEAEAATEKRRARLRRKIEKQP
ncbi:ribonuclease H-like domain-containing protein [Polyangium jinanense]|uniref:Ribonuclease H-like domain-containing protein n=1 Tax=Polyangium jinanense TaxID=2829994 RepID=A0A9X3X8P8_9BACT|nr:ribonuclease H-like domain-containing protein [Polyangium jinanense]MDC3957978.1 ribonuclease H-like domain-containing protein [Polyangium jinanense]MDC3983531.1 ribonuclease H-like domain-containing protein [Polyangium jinanense]